MSYVIRCTSGSNVGLYASPPGSKRSYTTKKKARRFQLIGAAEAECCGNEIVEKL